MNIALQFCRIDALLALIPSPETPSILQSQQPSFLYDPGNWRQFLLPPFSQNFLLFFAKPASFFFVPSPPEISQSLHCLSEQLLSSTVCELALTSLVQSFTRPVAPWLCFSGMGKLDTIPKYKISINQLKNSHGIV